MKALIVTAALFLPLASQAKDAGITCGDKHFKDCALKLFASSKALHDDVATFLGTSDNGGENTKAPEKDVQAFIRKGLREGDVDAANYNVGDGGDGAGMPAMHLGTVRLGTDSNVYLIDMTLTNDKFMNTPDQYGPTWRVSADSKVTKVLLRDVPEKK